MWAETRIQKPACAALVLPHCGGQQHKAWQHCRYSVSSISQGHTALWRWVRILVGYNHFSYTKGTTWGPILLHFLENLCAAHLLYYLCEMAQYNHYFLVNLRLLLVSLESKIVHNHNYSWKPWLPLQLQQSLLTVVYVDSFKGQWKILSLLLAAALG